MVATAACFSSRLTPPSPRGSTGERGGCQQKVCLCGFMCLRKKNTEREKVYVLVWESLICAPMYGCLSLGQGRTAQGVGHLTGHRWYRQTDRDSGDINTLINNYLNNDTGYTGVGGIRDRRTGGERETREGGT